MRISHSIKPLISALLTTISASALATPVSELRIEESFSFASTPEISLRDGGDFEDPTKPVYSGCYNSNYVELNARLFAGLVTLDTEVPVFVARKRSRRLFGGSPCKDDPAYRLGHDLDSSGLKLQEQLKPYIEGFKRDSRQELILEKMSEDGSKLYATLLYESEYTRKESVSGKLRVSLELKLDSCIDSYGFEILEKDKLSENSNVSQILVDLRRSTFADYARCNLRLTQGPALLDRTNKKISVYLTEFEVFREKPSVISVVKHGLSREINHPTMVAQLERNGPPVDENSEQAALDAANRFTTLIIEDYGDLLYELSENGRLSQEERQAAIRAYFAKNGRELAAQLDLIDQEFPRLALMTKLSLLAKINDMYVKIAHIENTITGGRGMSLDRFVQRRF